MFGKRIFRALAIATTASLIMASAAFADVATADGDNATPVDPQALLMGDVCRNATSSDDALLAISRNGNYGSTNVFKKGSSITWSVVSATAGLSATFPDGANGSIPSDWDLVDNNTMSPEITTRVSYAAPDSTGSFTGTITFRATGVRADDTTLTRDAAMSVTANRVTCAPANTAPTTPGAPGLAIGSATPNQGVFTLEWTASTDAESNPISYELQHKNSAPGAVFSTVATGISGKSYSFVAVTPEAEGTWTYQVRASDGALTSAYSAASSAIKVDQSDPNAPTASADRDPEDAVGGWFKDTVTVSFTDNGDPALIDASAGSGVNASTVPANVTKSTSGSHTVSGTVFDNAGNESAAGSITVKVDATLPVIGFTNCPTAPLLLLSSASANWTASDAHSGLATAASGSETLNTSTVGAKSVSATATDKVGLSNSATCNYSVIYDFAGFFSPVENVPAWNSAKAGSSIPVKFSLGGDQGLSIFEAGFPKLVATACPSGGTVDPIEEYATTTANSKLIYDALADQYNYVWKTDKNWAGRCYRLDVKLIDGTTHSALFKFSK